MSDENLYIKVKRQEVRIAELEDAVAKMKRLYDDMLCNLDDSNFSSRILKEKDGMKASLTVAADRIASVVEKVDGNTTNISKIEQTAEEIQSTVKAYKTSNDGAVVELQSQITQNAESITSVVSAVSESADKISEIEQTAEKISSQVSEYNNDNLKFQSEITQTADKITASVEANQTDIGNLASRIEQAAERISSTVRWDFDNVETVDLFAGEDNKDTGKVYYEKSTGLYHYYSNGEWKSTLNNAISSTFTQTAGGFELNGDIEISGNTYVGGNIYSSKIYDKKTNPTCFLEIGNEDGDYLTNLTFVKINPQKNEKGTLFQVYNSGTLTALVLGGAFIGNVNNTSDGDVFYVRNNWDFSNATNIEWGNNAPTAVFG